MPRTVVRKVIYLVGDGIGENDASHVSDTATYRTRGGAINKEGRWECGCRMATSFTSSRLGSHFFGLESSGSLCFRTARAKNGA